METLLIILTNLALLSTLIFLIIFIVRAVKRQNKRQPGIITLISFIVLITVSIIGSQLYPTGLHPAEDKEARLTQNTQENSEKLTDGFKLTNAANSIKSNIRAFKPLNPQPMHFIVYATPVINPLTKLVSTGGRTDTDRYLPVSAQDVINDNGNLKNTGGLILTDDPNLASFVLILDLTYVDAGHTFTYSDNSNIKCYNAINKFELYNLLSGESIKTEIETYATYVGELVSVTDSSKGKQMFAGTIGTRIKYGRLVSQGLSATEFPGYVEFVTK